MFALHAFLFDTEADLQQMEDGLMAIFADVPDFAAPALSRAVHPFTGEAYLVFLWPDWSMTVHADRGADAEADAATVRGLLGDAFPAAAPRGRVRLVFGDDKTLEYTNHVLWSVDFLREIPGVVIYDEEQAALWE